MSYSIITPHPSRGYVAQLSMRRETMGRRREDLFERSVDAASSAAAVAHEIHYVETGGQRPVFIRGRWLAVVGVEWVEVPAPADVAHEIKVGRWVA